MMIVNVKLLVYSWFRTPFPSSFQSFGPYSVWISSWKDFGKIQTPLGVRLAPLGARLHAEAPERPMPMFHDVSQLKLYESL